MDKKKFNVLLGAKKKVWSVKFDASTTLINAGTEASIDDLQDNAVTFELWAKPKTLGEGGIIGVMLSKNSYYFATANAGLYGILLCATTSAASDSAFVPNDQWHHIAFTFDDAGDRKIWTYLDGIKQTTYVTQTAGVGAITSDAAQNLYIGDRSAGGRCFDGSMGWIRISNNVRYTADFNPQSRFVPPAVDANTVRLFKMDEGSGTVITDYSANAQNASLANGVWKKQ